MAKKFTPRPARRNIENMKLPKVGATGKPVASGAKGFPEKPDYAYIAKGRELRRSDAVAAKNLTSFKTAAAEAGRANDKEVKRTKLKYP